MRGFTLTFHLASTTNSSRAHSGAVRSYREQTAGTSWKREQTLKSGNNPNPPQAIAGNAPLVQ
jgi:hypothetical protein